MARARSRRGSSVASDLRARLRPARAWTYAAACVCGLGSACGSPSTPPQGDPPSYLDDASFRRSELVASLVNPTNGYSAVRLAHYATGGPDDWDRLPEWNPASETIGAERPRSAGRRAGDVALEPRRAARVADRDPVGHGPGADRSREGGVLALSDADRALPRRRARVTCRRGSRSSATCARCERHGTVEAP